MTSTNTIHVSIESKRDLLLSELKRKLRQDRFRQTRGESKEVPYIQNFIENIERLSLNNQKFKLELEETSLDSEDFLQELSLLSLSEKDLNFNLRDLKILVIECRKCPFNRKETIYFLEGIMSDDLKIKICSLIGLRRSLEEDSDNQINLEKHIVTRLLELYKTERVPIVKYECICVLANYTSRCDPSQTNDLINTGDFLESIKKNLISSISPIAEQSCIILGNIFSELLPLAERYSLIDSFILSTRMTKNISSKTFSFTLRNISLDYSLNTEIRIKLMNLLFSFLASEPKDELDDFLCALFHFTSAGEQEKEKVLLMDGIITLLKRALASDKSDTRYMAICVLANLSETDDLEHFSILKNSKELYLVVLNNFFENDSKYLINALYFLTNILRRDLDGSTHRALAAESIEFESFLQKAEQSINLEVIHGYFREFLIEIINKFYTWEEMDIQNNNSLRLAKRLLSLINLDFLG